MSSLQYIKRYFKLVVLSNVDRASFARANRRLGVEFDAVYTAEDIGSYKPNPENFDYMLRELEKLGIGKGDILHTAQSLFHDHAQAKTHGLASAWIDRRQAHGGGWGATMPPPDGAGYDFHFSSLADFVEAHRRETGG